MKVIFAFLVSILAFQVHASSYTEGGPRHAFLKSREGNRIYIDFEKVIVANGGSSAASWYSDNGTISVYFPNISTGWNCLGLGPISVNLSNWKVYSSQPATQYPPIQLQMIARAGICGYSAKIPSLQLRSGDMGQFGNFRQYISVRTPKGPLYNPLRNNGEDQAYFETQLEQVPENGRHNPALEQ